jgi:hypothetical protein
MSAFVQVKLKSVADERGMLVVAQQAFGFDIRRVFWILGGPLRIRGEHRHHVTRQAFVAVVGSVEIRLDDGVHTATVVLDSPANSLLVEPDDWHSMHFSEGAVLLVFASHDYDPDDYIYEPYEHGMSK